MAQPRRWMQAATWAACMATGLAGCSPESGNLPAARMDLPSRFSAPGSPLTPAPQVDAATAAWWQGFKDPVLDALIARGMAGNVTLQIAAARLTEAEAQARGDSLPFSDSLSLDRNEGEFSTTTSTGLNIALPIGGRHASARAAALARIEAARYGVQDARLKLLGQVAQTYLDLRFYQARLVQTQEDLASRRKTVESLNARLAHGAATRLDILSAQALVAETEGSIPGLGARITRADARLATLLGQPAGSLGIDLSWTGRQPQLASPRGFGLPADLVRRRPDIRAAEAQYAEAVANVGQARAAFFPSLSLSGTLSVTQGIVDPSRSLGQGLSLPLLSLPRLKADEKAAVARAEQAYLAWRLAVLTAVEEVEAGLAEVAAARAAAGKNAQAVALNAEALDLSRQLMAGQGDVTALMLLDRERSLSQARAARAEALHEYASGVVALNVALGLGPDSLSSGAVAAPPTGISP